MGRGLFSNDAFHFTGSGKTGLSTRLPGNKATFKLRNFDVDSCKDSNIHAAVAVSSSLQGSLEVCTHGGVPMSIQQVCLC